MNSFHYVISSLFPILYIYIYIYIYIYTHIYSLQVQYTVQNLACERVTSVSLSPFLYDIHPEERHCCSTKKSYISG